MKTAKILLYVFIGIFFHPLCAQRFDEPPSWTKDLIIYELSPISFTSPHGPETGSFNSLKDKIPYLHDLGINAVWLTGHHWADHKHFYNIWTQYACIRPDSIDPVLGTREDFKNLIQEFHRHDIKVFLDVITHGVMSYSPLIYEKPRWFKGGTWGMTDYDWYGGHKDLDDWWVDIHTKYVTECGVDGFRLDVDIYRPDLWHQIKENARNAGHPVIVFAENSIFTDNVSDFNQTLTKVGRNTEEFMPAEWKRSHNVADAYHEFVDKRRKFEITKVIVTYMDDTEDFSDILKEGGKLNFQAEKTSQSNMKVTIKNLDPTKSMKRIKVFPSVYREPYVMEASYAPKTYPLTVSGVSEISVELTPISHDKEYLAHELSSHDRGWVGFPLDKNPYMAQGSRCIFGYHFMFTPAILFFMAGEEFDANFVPLPTLSPYLYQKEKVGEGRWLYGSWIQWDQLKQKKHQEMLADVKKMIAIRKQEKDVVHSVINDVHPNIEAVAYKSSDPVPVPYILWNDRKIILVAGNNLDKDVKLTVTLPVEKTGISGASQILVTDLWNGGKEIKKVNDPTLLTFQIKKDKTPGGGLAVFKIEIVK